MAQSVPSAILIVNDHRADLLALREALVPLGETILAVESAAEGLQLAKANDIAVAIIDIRMPAIDGFGMLEALRQDPQHRDLPVIFVSAIDVTPETIERVYALGAVDFVPLPVIPAMLRAKVEVFVKLHRQVARERIYAVEVRQAAATEVHTLQERFRLLVESVSDYALFFLDALGLVSDWTSSAERLLGYSAAEAVGQHFRFVFTSDDRAKGRPERELETAMTQGQSSDDTLHVRRDGTTVPVTGRTIALKERDGTLRGFAKIMRDATKLNALRESEAKYREIFDTANEGIWVLDRDMTIIDANRRMAEMLGVRVDELIGRRKPDFAFPEDAAYLQELFEQRRAGKSQSAIEVRFRHKDGSVVWTLLSARPIVRAGEFVGALDMFTDITARKGTELELAESRTRLRLAVDIADLGIFYHEGSSEILWSPHVKRLLGMREDETASLDAFVRRVHPDDLSRVQALLDRALGATNEEFEWEIEYRVVWPDGTLRWLKSSGVVNPREGRDQFHLVGILRDVTADKEFAAELERQIGERTRELEEKRQQLESFAYTVAHDLRAPLRAINGYAAYALDDITPLHLPQTAGYLERIRSSTTRLDTLVSDLLSYSRVSQVPLNVERVDLNHVVGTVLRELDSEIKRTGARVAVSPGMPAAEGDRAVVEQIVVNLVGNALKFAAADRAPEVDISAEDGGGRVRLSVRDRGIGIPREYHQRIFKVFERLQSAQKYPGTGIGLAIVARGMERMGGRYGVESALGQGSTFWIELKRFAA